MSGIPAARQGATVIRDPSGLYTPGLSTFRMNDLVETARQGNWPVGIRFRLNNDGQTATMVGKVMIRSDGAILDPGASGKWEWKV
jgi:hypothetical protein